MLKLNLYKSIGPDSINPHILDKVLLCLKHISNILPNALTEANAMHKKVNKNDPNNYIRICLTSHVTKLLSVF